ncbi:MAG: non-canonical purine NTP pyrophosphatase [Thermodesulfobacteriota bacterium]|nr:MAG: non-canonical purine NTP pyrophosphatase [Thermodesulfobacteriota bacterium]
MMKEVVLATGNQGKVREFSKLLEGVFEKVISLKELDSPPEVIEDGVTFRDNALKKARELALYSGKLTLADDSGLEVDALNGEPGVYSARYSGKGATDESNIEKLLIELGDNSNRKARFVCVLALVDPNGEELVVEGFCEGEIMDEPRGEGGFGYDPVFYLPDRDLTMAEIGQEEKNKISHRSNALKQLKARLKT